jgi:hypothetical protein
LKQLPYLRRSCDSRRRTRGLVPCERSRVVDRAP